MAIVYILTNAAMPGLVKIGCSERTIEDRLRELSSAAGIPVAFECFLAVEVPDPYEIERALHHAFGDRRVNPRREFFELSPDRPAAILRMFQNRELKSRDVTPTTDIVESKEEQDALDRERTRRSNFRFSQIGLQAGAELTSAFDDQIKCKVIDDRRVEFRGNVMSLSNAALVVAHAKGWKWTAIQGPLYWLSDGKSLAEIRDELEHSTE